MDRECLDLPFPLHPYHLVVHSSQIECSAHVCPFIVLTLTFLISMLARQNFPGYAEKEAEGGGEGKLSRTGKPRNFQYGDQVPREKIGMVPGPPQEPRA